MPLSQLSKWGIWKRAHRDNVGSKGELGTCSKCGARGVVHVHHVGNNYGSNANTRKLCVSCHNSERKGTTYNK